MKKSISLLLCLSVALISVFAQTRNISVDDAQVIANRNAAIKWGNVSPADPIIYYSADDQIVAYRFNYAINKSFPDKHTVFQECAEGKQSGNRKAQWGNGDYGNILMSARTDLPVNLEHGLGISSEFAYHEYLQEQAEAHLGSNYSLKRIYFINTVNIWHHYTNGSKDIYVKAHAPAKAGDFEVYQAAISEFDFFCETGDYNNQWDQYLYGEKSMLANEYFIINHDECCPFYDWSFGCTPTAGAMLFAYWDHMSMYSNWNFSKLVDYHFERTDTYPGGGGSCIIDSHCPNVMAQLATAMGTNSSGSTSWDDIESGYNTVAANNGYTFNFQFYDEYAPNWYIAVIWYEVDHDAPVHCDIEGHSVLAVGYNDSLEVATHYTHQPWIVWISYGLLKTVCFGDPVGPDDLGIEIIKPDGDQDYYGNGTGETMYAGDVYEISWDYDASPDSYVSLYYSTDHGSGSSWELITLNTPNDGIFDWVIPAGINSSACRIKINVYKSDDTYSGSDGSYGDFQISSGGSIYTLFSDSKVTTITTPDYYQFSNPYSTWCAVGVRPNSANENWNISMFSSATFTTELVTSTTSAPVDFVVMDRHHTSSFTRGIKAYPHIGLNDASVEFEGDQETLSIGTNGSYSWQAGDVVEMYDVYLTPGTYSFDLDITSGSADLDFGLFGSTDGIYRKDREAFLARSANIGYTINEYFTIGITTSDYYGLCVWANDGNSSTYNIDIHDPDPGTWEGDNSQYWADQYNWSLNMLPTASTDVTIPAGTPYNCMLFYGNISCNSLTVNSGAVLSINGHALSLMDMSIEGSVSMLHDNSIINIYGDVEWNAGSTLNFSSNDASINVYGNWNFNEGANVNPGLGSVDFRGTSTKYIRCFSDNCSFYKLRNYKTGGAALGLSAQSTEQLEVFMLTYLNTGSIFTGYSSHGMLMKGSFNYYGTFDFNTGSVTFDGTDIRQFSAGSGTFNNVIFNSTSGSHMINGDMTVKGDLSIEQGYFSPDTNTVFVARDWINNVGAGGFIPGTGRVIFNGGDYHQYCSNETFYELEIDKPSGGAFRMDGTNVECAAYDWTAGAVDVLSGSFTANDLVDDGVYGAFYTNPGGIINLHQPTGFADLNGDLILTGGGEINIYGSGSSWVPYAANASISMSGGVIDFKSTSVRIHDNHTLNTNISGGTIRTIGNFESYRTDFNPPAGTLEMYGTTGSPTLYQVAGSSLNNLRINKVDDDVSGFKLTPDIRDTGGSIKGSKANTVDLASNILVNNDLTISAGSLSLNGHELTVAHDCNVYGTLNMTDPADILNVGATFSDRLWFYSGSTGNLNEGVANIYGWFQPEAGCSLNGSTNHTTVFKGVSGGGPNNFEPTATYGNIEIYKTAGHTTYISSQAILPIVVTGDFTIHDDNEFVLQDKTMIVHGLFNDNSASEIYTYNPAKKGSSDLSEDKILEQDQNIIAVSSDESGSKGGYLEIDTDFVLNGLLDVGDGDVYVHGHYDQSSTATLSIGSGSFICDAPTTAFCSIYGTLNLVDGLFEISNNHLRLNALCNVSGGTIRSGGTFWASLDGNFQPTGGVIELIGTGASGQYISVHTNNYFHDLTINRTNPIQIYTGYDLDIRNDFTILSGGLNTNSLDMYVGGNWTNNVGPAGFVAGTGIVIFGSSSGIQYVYGDNIFYNVQQDFVATGRYLQFSGPTNVLGNVVLNYFTWINDIFDVQEVLDLTNPASKFTANLPGIATIANLSQGGTVVANGGTIDFLDLVEPGVFGTVNVVDGTLNFFQDATQYPDINADVNISGGTLNISGGTGGCVWGYSSPASITMSNGALNILGNPVSIGSSFTETISGGILSFDQGFNASNPAFTPTGGTVRLIGGVDDILSMNPAANFFNVEINKSGGKSASFEYKDRDGNMYYGNKGNTIGLASDVNIFGNFTVNSGVFNMSNYTANISGNTTVNTGGTLSVNTGGTLAMDDVSDISVNSGGVMEILNATITHISTGYYDFNVIGGGTIAAESSLFEYTSVNGVFVWDGATVDPVNSFNYCTFQNGYPGNSTMLIINNADDITITEAHFPDASSTLYNAMKEFNYGTITMVDATGDFAGEDYDLDPYNRINWSPTSRTLDLTVFMEGPYNPGTGKLDTDINGLLPLGQPYHPPLPYYGNSAPDWYYTGTESVGAIPNVFVVDWVLLQLRDATSAATASSATAFATIPAFILNNGEVVDLDGLNPVTFLGSVANDLFVVIWHRNHLGVISANPLIESGGSYIYDFSSSATQAFGGTSGHKELEPGVWGMIAADGDADGNILPSDETNAWATDMNTSGYLGGDFDMNGLGQASDKTGFWVPNANKSGQVPSALGGSPGYSSQVPD